MTRSNLLRGIATAAVILVWGWLNFFLNTAAPLASNPAAVKQFDNSDSSYVVSQYGMRLFSWTGGMSTLALLVLLLFLWRSQLKNTIGGAHARSGGKGFLVAAFLALFLLPAANAFAYYDKNDYTEAYFILPNESAFFIPDIGANKDNQAKFGSTEYLEANKVAAKRFVIPHAKFSGSGFFADYYVPTGRLIIVDRTPYNREWVAAHDRGSSARNESFPCQSQEGLNITAEVAIATSVSEENAAKFLYWFGVRPPQGDRRDPQVIFTSIYQGRSLSDVMDTVGRGKVQSLVCHEIGARTFEQANKDMNVIMDVVEKNAGVFLASRGITLDYIGWAGTFTFDPDVQKAVNDRYVAATVASSMPTLQALAEVRVKEGLGDGLRSKGLPASLVAIPDRLLGTLSAMFGKVDQPTGAK